MPERCNDCIFISRNPNDNQWECTNPLQDEDACQKSGNCMFHLTCEELAVYFRQRLKAKLTGKSNMIDKQPHCKYILDDGKCSKIDGFKCPFVDRWDTATKLCKGYEFAPSRFEVHVLGKSISIIGMFKSHEQAEQFIKDNIKIVEMTP